MYNIIIIIPVSDGCSTIIKFQKYYWSLLYSAILLSRADSRSVSSLSVQAGFFFSVSIIHPTLTWTTRSWRRGCDLFEGVDTWETSVYSLNKRIFDSRQILGAGPKSIHILTTFHRAVFFSKSDSCNTHLNIAQGSFFLSPSDSCNTCLKVKVQGF